MNDSHMGPQAGADGGDRKWKAVFTIVEPQGRSSERKFWIRVGTAFSNRDGSLNVRLDAMPVNGMLHIRDQSPDDGRPRRDEGAFGAQKGLV